MANDFDISVNMTGLDALTKKLQGLSYDMQKKGGRFALRKAAQVIRDAAKQNATFIDDPDTSKKIYKNITEKWNGRLNKTTGDLGFRVGVLGGARDYSASGEITTGKDASANPGGDTFYWRFVEFGTEKMKAQPFLVPAMNNSTQKATDAFIREYSKAIDRVLARAGKNG